MTFKVVVKGYGPIEIDRIPNCETAIKVAKEEMDRVVSIRESNIKKGYTVHASAGTVSVYRNTSMVISFKHDGRRGDRKGDWLVDE